MRKRCQAKGKSKLIDDDTVASLCAGIILRHCNSRMTPIPRIISLLLYSEHTTQLVRTIFETVVCMLGFTNVFKSISIVDLLGKDHDAPVITW